MRRQRRQGKAQHDLGRARRPAALPLHEIEPLEEAADIDGEPRQFRPEMLAGAPDALAEAFRFEPSYPFADIRALLPPAPPITPVTVSTVKLT